MQRLSGSLAEAGEFDKSNRFYKSSDSCSGVIWQSRRIFCRRPGPIVSPERAGTTVHRPSWCRRKYTPYDEQNTETNLAACGNELGTGDTRSAAHAATVTAGCR